MDNHAPSFLPAARVVEGEVFKPVVGQHTGFLGITIRVDVVPSIVTTCERVYSELSAPSVPALPTAHSQLPCRVRDTGTKDGWYPPPL